MTERQDLSKAELKRKLDQLGYEMYQIDLKVHLLAAKEILQKDVVKDVV